MATIVTGLTFGKALCNHLGIDSGMVAQDFTFNCKPNEVLGVTLTVSLSPADIAAIGKLMED